MLRSLTKRQSARYFSRIDPQALLRAAQGELAESDPPTIRLAKNLRFFQDCAWKKGRFAQSHHGQDLWEYPCHERGR